MAKTVDQNLKLDEILDICADFEKQIQAEQDELKRLAQRKLIEEAEQSSGETDNGDNASGVQFGSISFFPSTPPLPARRGGPSPLKSPPCNGLVSHQWSPINTMSPNRYVQNIARSHYDDLDCLFSPLLLSNGENDLVTYL